jgi:hypothetical protein
MPQGKGVLRIAIEDFLATFGFTDKAKKLVKDIGEHNEVMINEQFGEYLTLIHKVPELANVMKLQFNPDGSLKNQGSILTFGGLAAGIGNQAASNLFAPWGRKLNYLIDKDAKSARITLEAAIAAYWRAPEYKDLLTSDISDLGWNTDRTTVMTKLSRPRLQVTDWVNLYLRGKESNNDLTAELTAKGFLPEDIERIKELAKVIPNIPDLISMAVREAFDDRTSARFGYDNEYPAEVEQWAAKQGLDPLWVKRYWRSHWELPSVTLAYEMLHRLRPGTTANTFTSEDMDLLLKAADYPTFWRERMKEVSFAPFTRVDVRRMYKLKVLDRNGVKNAYLDLGYDNNKAEMLTEFTVRYETESGTSKLDEMDTLSEALSKQMYLAGIINVVQFKQYLAKYYFNSEDVNRVVQLADLQRKLDVTPDKLSTYINQALNNYISAYTLRMINRNDASSKMSALGLPAEQITIALDQADYDYTMTRRNRSIEELSKGYQAGSYSRGAVQDALGKMNVSGQEQTQILSEFDDLRNFRYRRLTEAQYKKLFVQGVIDEAKYRQSMADLGYDDESIGYLVILATGEDATNG